MRQPAWFLAHGAPFHTLGDNTFSRFWQALPERLHSPPKAILCISAHWTESQLTLAGDTETPMIEHDFYGFPDVLYAIRWSVAGGTQQAPWLRDRLAKAGITVTEKNEHPFDHGVWAPLRRIWPEMTIPLFQLSLVRGWQGEDYLRLGASLSQLRDDGVLIIGSGNLTHNLHDIDFHAAQGDAAEWAATFMQALDKAIATRDPETLANPWLLPGGRHAHPTLEHYWPLLPVIASNPDPVVAMLREWTLGTLCMHSYTS
ncbi:dioxygenase [Mariprofundus erugo]|uniref:Dioxygenase n=1 Tax=Mariprofundus erugo TaxID=2528639 RepID=A0A5R9GRW9_9PROT|nr:class III extradiol ring-cleavage dioxygenase [Mariprofundus erugo]TLS68298.1 dioxygenase [Mariprofundus erugo]